MLGTRPGAGWEELLMLYGEAALSQWPTEARDSGADGADPEGRRRGWPQHQPDADADAGEAPTRAPQCASPGAASASGDSDISCITISSDESPVGSPVELTSSTSGESWLNDSTRVTTLGSQIQPTPSTSGESWLNDSTRVTTLGSQIQPTPSTSGESWLNDSTRVTTLGSQIQPTPSTSGESWLNDSTRVTTLGSQIQPTPSTSGESWLNDSTKFTTLGSQIQPTPSTSGESWLNESARVTTFGSQIQPTPSTSGESWLNDSTRVTTHGIQIRATHSTPEVETQQDLGALTSGICTPMVGVASGSGIQKSPDATRCTRKESPPVQNLEDPSRAHSSHVGPTFEIPLAGSSAHSPSSSSSSSVLPFQIDSDSKVSDSNEPTDLSIPKIVPREADSRLTAVSDEWANNFRDSWRPPTPRPGPNMSENYQYDHGVPPQFPEMLVMVPESFPYQPLSVVVFGKDGRPIGVLPVSSFIYPTGQPHMFGGSPNFQQDRAPQYEFSNVSDEDGLERNRQPKIIELKDDDQVLQNEPLHNKTKSDNSDVDCADETQPGPSGVVFSKPLSTAKTAAPPKHQAVTSEQNSLPTAQSHIQPLGHCSSPAVNSSSFHAHKSPAELKPVYGRLKVKENFIQRRTDQPQLARSPLQATSSHVQVHDSSSQSLESNQPSLMQQTPESRVQPRPAEVHDEASPPHLLQKQTSPSQLPLPQLPRVETQSVQPPTAVKKTGTLSVKSEMSTDRLLKSPLKSSPACTSACTTFNENVSCSLPSALPFSVQNTTQNALPDSPSVQMTSTTTSDLFSDQVEYQPVPLRQDSMWLTESPGPPSTQKINTEVNCFEPAVMSPHPMQKTSLKDQDDDAAAAQLSPSSTSSSATSPSQPNSPQPLTASPPAGNQLLAVSSPEHNVQSPPAAVGQDSPLPNTELPMSLLSPHSPELNGVAIKSKSVVKRSREPWDHKGLIRFVGCFAFTLPRRIWTPRREGEPRRSVRIAEKMKAKRYFLRSRFLVKRATV